jgi:hypothetical protein
MIYFSLGILILTEGASLYWRRSFGNSSILKKFDLKKLTLAIFIFSIFLIFFLLFCQSYQQFQVWSQNEVSKFLLPPHRSITYFIFYIGTRSFAPYLISLVVAFLFLFSAKILNKKYQEQFFYPEEPYFGALAIFLTGHPGWIFYAIFIIFIYLLIHILLSLAAYRLSLRLSLYYLWLPVAIFVIIIQDWLAKLPLWSLLKL